MDIEVPKLYLECGHCHAPGVSITVLLTGLSSGEASLQLKLNAAHFAAKHSYGEAQQDMAAHYGQDIERHKQIETCCRPIQGDTMTRIHSLAVRTLHAGMKLGPVPVSISSVIPIPMPQPPTTSLWPLACARVPRSAPAPHAPQLTDAAPPAPAGNVCDQMEYHRPGTSTRRSLL